QLSTASAGSGANSVPAIDPTSILQASLAAATRQNSAAGPGNANVNQATVKAIQSKVSGSASGLNSDATDGTKTAKSGDARDDLSSLNGADLASLQTLSTQPGGAHVAATETKGNDAVA